jgi:hypothetical protein
MEDLTTQEMSELVDTIRSSWREHLLQMAVSDAAITKAKKKPLKAADVELTSFMLRRLDEMGLLLFDLADALNLLLENFKSTSHNDGGSKRAR